MDSSLDAEAVNGMEVLLRLSEGDLRNLKADESLCRGSHDCFIKLAGGVATDLNAIESANTNLADAPPVPVTTYIGECTMTKGKHGKSELTPKSHFPFLTYS